MRCKCCEQVQAALDDVTMCMAATPAQRIRDAFKHNRLWLDAIVFEMEKTEQSLRTQITYWSEMSLAVLMRREDGPGS